MKKYIYCICVLLLAFLHTSAQKIIPAQLYGKWQVADNTYNKGIQFIITIDDRYFISRMFFEKGSIEINDTSLYYLSENAEKEFDMNKRTGDTSGKYIISNSLTYKHGGFSCFELIGLTDEKFVFKSSSKTYTFYKIPE